MFLRKGLIVAVLLATKLSYASVWAPTAAAVGDTNFFDLNTLLGSSSGLEFGIFEDNADLTTANPNPVLTFFGGTSVKFSPNSQNPANWDLASSNSANGTLLGSYNFQIGYKRNGIWEAEQSSALIPLLGANAWQLSFGQESVKTLYVIDAEQATLVSEIPVANAPLPATAWFMLSALMGILFVDRRKTN